MDTYLYPKIILVIGW